MGVFRGETTQRATVIATLACALAGVGHGIDGVFASTAHAQSRTEPSPDYLPEDAAERDEQARSAFQDGRIAYEDGRYRDAWGHFHRSYNLSQRPELLYNIGQTADRLGQDADALKAFRLYLQRLPDAANRREVENRVKALEERVRNQNDVPAPPGEQEILEPPAPETETEATLAAAEEAPPPPKSSQPKRTGWYFRGALGLGVRRIGASDTGWEASIVGAGVSGELTAGITVLPGFVVGGGLFFDWTSSPTISIERGGSEFDTKLESANLTMLGAMADFYPSPERDGWHVQGALTLAVLDVSRGDGAAFGEPIGAETASGFGLLAGGGYEWPINDEWALGVIGRVTFASVSIDSITYGAFTPSVLATVTWY
jgi:hypothetical protein